MGFWAKCWVSGWMEWIPHRLLWLLKHLQYNCTAQFPKTVFLHNQQRLLTSCYSGWWSPSQSTTSSSVTTFDQLLFRFVVPIPVYKIILHNNIFSNDFWPGAIQVGGPHQCWATATAIDTELQLLHVFKISKIIATAFSLRYLLGSNFSLFLELLVVKAHETGTEKYTKWNIQGDF